jgi:hypothetical protein
VLAQSLASLSSGLYSCLLRRHSSERACRSRPNPWDQTYGSTSHATPAMPGAVRTWVRSTVGAFKSGCAADPRLRLRAYSTARGSGK